MRKTYVQKFHDDLDAIDATAPSPGFLAEFLSCLVGGLATQDDVTQEIISALENAADACHEEASAINRREEDLDAPVAAKSDERYSRMVDDGLIERGIITC